MTTKQLLPIFLESQDFYELMQAYRFTSIDAAKEFEAVKVALRAAIAQPEQPHDKTIDAIMDGIDREQTDRPEGLWETSTGAAHGRKMLAEIKALFASALAQPESHSTTNDTTREDFEAWLDRPSSHNPDTSMRKRSTAMERVFALHAWQAATAQGKRQPLTDNEIEEVWEAQQFNIVDFQLARDFVRDIEESHGIKATPPGDMDNTK